MNKADFKAVRDLVTQELGAPDQWTAWPGGWPNEIATALIDAVFSARATYKTAKGKGVHALVVSWRIDHDPAHRDSLQALSAEIGTSPQDARDWAESFGSQSHSPGRKNRRPDNPLKSAAVREAAESLNSAGVGTAADITSKQDAARRAMRSVPGIGKATTDYFLMLLGHTGVKADVMVHRLLTRALGHSVNDAQAVELVSVVATELGQSPTHLDHAIWAAERELAATSD